MLNGKQENVNIAIQNVGAELNICVSMINDNSFHDIWYRPDNYIIFMILFVLLLYVLMNKNIHYVNGLTFKRVGIYFFLSF